MNKNGNKKKQNKPLISLDRLTSYIFNLTKKKHNINIEKYNKIMIKNIIFDEGSKLVTFFKEHLLFNDSSEFIKRYYSIKESLLRLKRYFEFYSKYSKLFPNYIPLNESKYIYKNIHRKQKIIDIQQEEESNQKQKNLSRNKRIKFDKIFSSELYEDIFQNSQSMFLNVFGINKEEDENSEKFSNQIKNIINKISKYKSDELKNWEKETQNKSIIINNYYYNNSSLIAKQSQHYEIPKSKKEEEKLFNRHLLKLLKETTFDEKIYSKMKLNKNIKSITLKNLILSNTIKNKDANKFVKNQKIFNSKQYSFAPFNTSRMYSVLNTKIEEKENSKGKKLIDLKYNGIKNYCLSDRNSYFENIILKKKQEKSKKNINTNKIKKMSLYNKIYGLVNKTKINSNLANSSIKTKKLYGRKNNTDIDNLNNKTEREISKNKKVINECMKIFIKNKSHKYARIANKPFLSKDKKPKNSQIIKNKGLNPKIKILKEIKINIHNDIKEKINLTENSSLILDKKNKLSKAYTNKNLQTNCNNVKYNTKKNSVIKGLPIKNFHKVYDVDNIGNAFTKSNISERLTLKIKNNILKGTQKIISFKNHKKEHRALPKSNGSYHTKRNIKK